MSNYLSASDFIEYIQSRKQKEIEAIILQLNNDATLQNAVLEKVNDNNHTWSDYSLNTLAQFLSMNFSGREIYEMKISLHNSEPAKQCHLILERFKTALQSN